MFSKFEIHHNFPRCPYWEKMGFSRHNKSTKTGSPTPVFRCYDSTKTYKTGTMAHIIQSFVSPSAIVNSINTKAFRVSYNTQLNLHGCTADQPHNLDMVQFF